MLHPIPFKDWLVGKFSRTTTSGEIVREIDGFRFIAISSVALHHLLANLIEAVYRIEMPPGGWQDLRHTHYLVWLLSPTWFGVQLFFVISGFVLGLPFARHYLSVAPAPELKSYYLRRLTRIEPPYFIALTVYMILLSYGDPHWRDRLPHFIASLFYAHNFVYGEMTRIGTLFWSLEVEIQFYLLAPFLALLFAIKTATLRRVILVGIVAAWGFGAPRSICRYSDRASLSILCNLQYFLAGFLLVELYLTGVLRSSTKTYFWDCGTALTASALAILLLKYWEGWWLLPFMIVLLYVGFFLGRIGNRLITHPLIYITGGMCYTIYLFHALIIARVGQALTFRFSAASAPLITNLLLQAILLAPIVLAVSAVLFVVVERPFMRLQVRVN